MNSKQTRFGNYYMAYCGQPAGGDIRTLERGSPDETERQPYGQLFPACSPRNSDGGETDWGSVEEKILRDVSEWLSPADLRRARLVCKSWLAALATLSTKAITPSEPSTVTKWKAQLEAMVAAMPCLQELTIGSKLSAVGAQQLGILAGAHQLRVLNIPYGQALQDRSLQALQPLSPTLRELRIRGAASLSQRALLLLSVLGNLEVLELKFCGKISWAELQEAWRLACLAYEAQLAEASSPQSSNSHVASSYSVATKLGGWLPGGGRLFRTSSPCSSSIQTALVKQKSGGGGLLARMARKSQTGPGAAAAAVAQTGEGAVGNGRSSSGGGSQEQGAVRKMLQRKQKQKMGSAAAAGQAAGDSSATAAAATAAAAQELLMPIEPEQQLNDEAGQSISFSVSNTGSAAAQQHQQQLTGWSISSSSSGLSSPLSSSTTSALYRVGSLVWQGTTAAAAVLSSGSSIARQSSAVQSALLTYLSEAEAAADVCSSVRRGANVDSRSVSLGDAGSSSGSYNIAGTLQDSSRSGCGSANNNNGNSSRFSPSRRRPSASDKPLPAMPFPKLTSLSFTCSEVTLRNPAAELAAVASLTALTALEMCKCKVPDAVLWRLTNLVRLQKLKLSGLWLMGDAGVAEVAKLTALKSLTLSEAMHITASGLMALSQLSRLTSLSLGLTQDVGPGVLGKLIRSVPGLQCVEMTASCWCDVDCELLAEAAAAPNLVVAAAAAAAAASQQVPHMLWNIPTATCMSRSNSSKLLQPGVALSTSSSRSNSSHNLRMPSVSSMVSFGGFSSYNLSAAIGGSTTALQAPQQQQLLVLKLHGCLNIGHAGMAALKRLPALQALVLDGCKNINSAEVISQDLLPPQLTSLSMRSLPFGNAFISCVNVPVCSVSLLKLELVSVSAIHNGQLRRILSFFPELRELSLAGSIDVGDAAMKHIALLPKLQQLNLAGTRVTSQGLDQLLYLPDLKTLSLKGCTLVTDAGLRLLELYPALQEIDMSECSGVSERGFLAVMLGVQKLVRLDVRGCRAVTRQLVQWCPHFLHLKHSL